MGNPLGNRVASVECYVYILRVYKGPDNHSLSRLHIQTADYTGYDDMNEWIMDHLDKEISLGKIESYNWWQGYDLEDEQFD